MRKQVTPAILIGLAAVLFVSSPAMAVPSLQLDIGNGTYDWTTQTIVASSDTFTLYALLKPTFINRTWDTYFISAALVPKTASPENLGTFYFDGAPVDATGDMVYGIPPVEADETAGKDPGDLAPHGIFKTYFTEFSFKFDTDQKSIVYNTQDDPGGFAETSGSPFLYYMAFSVDMGSLANKYNIHFDLYNEVARCSGDYDISAKAPFSHDAESKRVPEPGTFLLLGSGLFSLVGYRRLNRS
jgi:hypothetical protein